MFGWFPRDERGLALGIRQTAVPAGAAIASFTLPPLAAAAGVHAPLYALAGVMLVAAIAAAVWMRDGAARGIRRAAGARRRARPAHLAAQRGQSSLMIVGQVGLTSLLVLYLYRERHWTAAHAALALGFVQVGAALARVLGGPLVRPPRRADRAVPAAGRRRPACCSSRRRSAARSPCRS